MREAGFDTNALLVSEKALECGSNIKPPDGGSHLKVVVSNDKKAA